MSVYYVGKYKLVVCIKISLLTEKKNALYLTISYAQHNIL